MGLSVLGLVGGREPMGVGLGVCGVMGVREPTGVGLLVLGRWMGVRSGSGGMRVAVPGSVRAREAPPQQAHAEERDEESRRGAQPRVQALGHDVA